MIELLLLLFDVIEGAVTEGMISEESGAEFLKHKDKVLKFAKKYASVKNRLNPLNKIRKFRSKSLKTIKSFVTSKRKLSKESEMFVGSLSALERQQFKDAMAQMNNAQRQKALNIIRKYKAQHKDIKSKFAPNMVSLLTRNTNQMLNEIFNLDKDTKEFDVGNGVEFAVLSSS
ncbi:MAG: hypothetical protein ACRCXT_18720 [Paraclostridium sp.]